MRHPSTRLRLAAPALALPLVLAACGDAPSAAEPEPTTEEVASDVREEAAPRPRLVVTYDGGLQVLDALTLEPVADLELDGFTRVNAAGDGRHVLVSTTGGFHVLDAGTWAEAHGDHAHHYSTEPQLTDVVWEAETPGHVVVHDGRTVLFDDGTGRIVSVPSAEVAEGPAAAHEVRETTTPHAHHGVAVELASGELVVSEGTEEARTGIRVLDASGAEVAASDACPGVHGEAVAADDAVVIGCEDGVLVYRDGAITKVASPDPYGRIGNQAGSEASPVVLGDYKANPDAELERPTRVSLVDTRTATLRLVDLPASYTFRSLARGDDGEALVLGTDGALHVLDPETGALVRSTPVVEPWTEPDDWQSPRPAVVVLEGSAYVTDPATRTVSAVDVETGEVWLRAELSVTPNEVAAATGAAEATGEHDH
ncbi:PQQ-like beta-propeller repeat protein [Actinotalea ferrariae]|uniref:zinc metallochaperone AztD n=1 Tax=Actinotalea ferrariae TaxID=1386098 RepID=UPI001C8C265C|nr:zinc metallochaperone AztD [Actinotalea ferrariae]MBX9246196.1 PQQ-like beta-propeller repeat protein [Actinotalea ferrariae]